jgi:FAD/FMN-containing dehydrogenase/Fe-S oxidoreductase
MRLQGNSVTATFDANKPIMPQIFTDKLTRRLYANDASMYEELPSGVTFPSSAEDISKLVKLSMTKDFTITARSAGTSLAGQTTGNGIIMDTSRYMRDVLHIDPEKKIAHVQPGVIRDTLNREISRYGLQFGPDTATTNRCMIGGMIGNNSCGAFSIKHKTTRENILEIEAVLSDGTVTVFKPLTANELDEKCKLTNLEGRIYRGMIRLLKENRDRILLAYPHPEIIRRNTGYALDRLCEMEPITPGGRPFNLAELLCGSEGTLAMTVSAKLKLVPVDPYRLLVIPQFESLNQAMEAAVEAVKFDPSAVELVDDIILNATKGNIEQKKNRFFLEGEPKCLLIIQFEGRDPARLQEKARQLTDVLQQKKLGYTFPVIAEETLINRVWEVRKAGLGLLMGLGKDSQSPTFVEDTAVRVADLPAYVRDFQELLKKYETHCVFYAHASVGELHLRPVIDITTREGVEKMKRMADDVADLVAKYRGSLSGEHGDGRARAPFINKILGNEMMPLLRAVKLLWDQHYRFNPGKILDAKPIDSDLRKSQDNLLTIPETVFKWRREGGFAQALEQCNGAGVCRKLPESGGTMCPSYHSTLDEIDSTRGRANLFRQIFKENDVNGFSSKEIKKGLELCLSCKACKSECPANVDMARMKAEFLNGWYKENGYPLLTRMFGEPDKFYPVASAFAPLVNFMLKRSFVRYMMQETVGIDARRILPSFAHQTFRSWFKENRQEFDRGNRKKAALFVDLFTDYHDPDIAKSACRVLNKLGYDVMVPSVKVSGRPQISLGLMDQMKEICDHNINILDTIVSADIPVIGLEPSELLTIRDEYLDLCSDHLLKTARHVANNSWLFEEFLLRHFKEHPEDLVKVNPGNRKISLHGHCHTKALVGNQPLMDLLNMSGFVSRDLQTGCCGMAGSFGYVHDRYEVSMDIGEKVLFPEIRKLNRRELICAPGFSCRHQISDGTGAEAFHPAEIFDRFM